MASAGRILIMPKGNYSANTEYEMLDMVIHNGKSWLAKKTVKGIEPSAANSEYWHDLITVTPANIGALSTSGGTLTGSITIKHDWASLSLADSTERKALMEKNTDTNFLVLYAYKDYHNHNCLMIAPETVDINSSIILRRVVDGDIKTYKMFGEHNLALLNQYIDARIAEKMK